MVYAKNGAWSNVGMHHRCLGVTSGCARGFKISNSKCGFDHCAANYRQHITDAIFKNGSEVSSVAGQLKGRDGQTNRLGANIDL